MPWIQIAKSENRAVWLRTEAIVGLATPERGGTGTRLLLVSGEALEVAEERDGLLQKIRELEGTAARDRRVGFPAEIE
ncbi:MAG TPA: hypothetical protein VGH73_21510 [Thermoanaerobaculia bacterium]|jgi:hypothetical protein